MKFRRLVAVAVTALFATGAESDDADKFFEHSYAVVIGIDTYANPSWPKLTYAVSDAQAIAQLLRSQGFVVTEILEKQATKTGILKALDDQLAPILGENDRVFVFFAGHGTSRMIGDSEHGYLIPADAGDTASFSSFIPLNTLLDLSDTMGAAKHQLFVLDSCFGGLAAMRSGNAVTFDPRTPNYLYEVSRRKARQLLTAGGKDQQVRDGGPAGHSFFAGELIKAVKDGMADVNGDGFVTFNELTAYIVPAATSYNQTPGVASMAGHGLGEFWFRSMAKPTLPPSQPGTTPAQTSVDVYALLRAGKRAYTANPPNYREAQQAFLQAASQGNAEAMNFLGKIYWEGLAGAENRTEAIRWLEASADRGNISAMESLVTIYGSTNGIPDPANLRKWQRALTEAKRLEASISINDPTGQAQGDPKLPRDATVVKVPSAPMNISVQ